MVEPVLLDIALSTWANILVALATFVLAFITWKTIKHSRKELNLLKQQTLLLQKQQEPFLEIDEFHIKDNNLNFIIKNTGAGKALQIGVLSNFYLLNEKLLEMKKQDGKIMGRYDMGYDPFVLLKEEGKEFFGKHYVNFISKNQKSIIILKPGENYNSNFEPFFYIQNTKVKTGENIAQTIKFDDLIKIVKKNKRRFFCVEFNLIYKNILGKVQEVVPMPTFIFDTADQKSLEEGYKKNTPPNIRALSQREIEQLIGGIDYEIYCPKEKE